MKAAAAAMVAAAVVTPDLYASNTKATTILRITSTPTMNLRISIASIVEGTKCGECQYPHTRAMVAEVIMGMARGTMFHADARNCLYPVEVLDKPYYEEDASGFVCDCHKTRYNHIPIIDDLP